MKIDNSGKPLGSVSSRPANTGQTDRLRSSATSTASATSTEGIDASAAPFDADKVANIRQAIAEGRFTVRTEAVADKLVDSVKELLAK